MAQVNSEHTVTATISPAVQGIPVNFDVSGANSAGGTVGTNDQGVAEFTYTGTVAGVDTIHIWVDQDLEATFDSLVDPYYDVAKYWFAGFVTGGGTIKDGKKPAWNISGNLGYLPDGTIIGSSNIVDHAGKNQYKAHNTFTSLVLTGDKTTSPPASNNVATFIGTFTGKNGDTYELTIVITDNDESGGGADTIEISGGLPGWDDDGPISSGNYQIYDGFK